MKLLVKTLVPLILIVLAGCAQDKSRSGGTSAGNPSGDAVDISGVAPDSSTPLPPIFPHPEGWQEPEKHGPVAQQYGFDACLQCHKTDAKKGAPPACTSCHSLLPHPKNWVNKDQHGEWALKNGKSSCATQCHGPDLQGGLSQVSCNLCHSVYPHATNWRTPEKHGLLAKGNNKSLCRVCHGADLKGGDSNVSCFQCHTTYPHEEGWDDPSQHGATVLKNGQASCTTQCHGSDLKGGISGVSCTQCHTTYPHSDNWSEATEHGMAVKKRGKELCQVCHGTDLTGGNSQTSCYQCHDSYPHAPGWGDKNGHGTFVLQNGQEECATQCHGSDLKGGLSEVSCNSCHQIYPHPASWLKEHGTATTTLGKTVCQECHGNNFQKMLGGKNCYSCHADYPHPEKKLWVPYQGGHGERVQTTYQGSVQSCTLCHGANLTVKQDGYDCFSCHASFPHKTLNQSFNKSEGKAWRDYEGHGQYTLLHSRTECAPCHGNDYKGGKNPSCFSCHPPYPHTANWKQSNQHGSYVVTNGNTSCATAHCHGADLSPIPGVTQGIGCNGCHKTYPHPADWDSGGVHGPLAKQDIKICKTCHGSGLDKAPNGFQSCKSCHASYLKHQSAGIEPVSWGTFQGHGQYLLGDTTGKKMAECQTCHGADYTGGISNKSCKSCHENYPHTDPNWNQGEGHGKFVLETLKNDKTSCKLCHGNDLKGGNSKVSCTQCHASYPHTDPNWKSKEGHGKTILNTTGKIAECQTCHKDEDQAGTASQGCKSCHASYPHDVPDWKQAVGHGKYLLDTLKGDKSSCALCHGSDLKGGDIKISCTQCHADYPHPSGWKQPGQHGNKVTQNGKAGCATQCHGTDLKGGASGISCFSCHQNAYPHPSDWKQGKLHGPAALASIDTCKTCHGPALDKAPAGFASCKDCHATYLSHASAKIAVVDWKSLAGHGQAVPIDPVSKKKDATSCQLCHGADYTGGISEKNCQSCHASYPHLDVQWKDDIGHGKFVMETLKGDKTSCQLCHGKDLKGGNAKVSCTQCHASYPHEPGWKEKTQHGKYVLGLPGANTFEKAKGGCQGCHGSTLDGGGSKVSCSQCHSGYPHPASGWATGAGHGKSYNATCQQCHGGPLPFQPTDTKDSLKSQSLCYTCHWAYPHVSYEDAAWEPVVTNQCGPPKITNWSHVFFLFYSPLFSTKEGVTPVIGITPTNSPLWTAAIGNTCGGGTAGSCHFDGYRSYNSNGNKDGLCGSYCHGTTKPPAPKLPDCPPVPYIDPCQNDPALCEE